MKEERKGKGGKENISACTHERTYTPCMLSSLASNSLTQLLISEKSILIQDS